MKLIDSNNKIYKDLEQNISKNDSEDLPVRVENI